MASMIAGWIGGIFLGISSALLSALTAVMGFAGSFSLTLATQPWVGQATAVAAMIAGSLLALGIAKQAVTDWILWNEGTASHDQPTFWKAAMRVGVYGGASTFLALGTFRFGFQLAEALMVTPVAGTTHLLFAYVNGISSLADAYAILLLALLIVISVLAVLIVVLQMFIRAAELIIFVVAGPIVALGWLSPHGGVWTNWWKNLVVLSLSTAVQWLCLHGLIATVATSTLTTTAGVFVGVFEILGWAWVAITGPHLLKEFAYRTGMGSGGGTFIGGIASRSGTRIIGGGRL